jgi:hypothetical protein
VGRSGGAGGLGANRGFGGYGRGVCDANSAVTDCDADRVGHGYVVGYADCYF